MPYVFCALCLLLAAAFIFVEHKEKYIPAVILKGAASLCFVIFGLFCGKQCTDGTFAHLVTVGLLLGCIADVLLNLRFVFAKKGQLVFLVGILVFLSGHILYLVALIPHSTSLALSIGIGIVLTALVMVWIFRQITAKMAFKIFGVFYVGAIMIMTCVAVGILLSGFTVSSLIFVLGAVLFLISDIVLILNTFGPRTRFSLRVTNLSLYYIAQLLIGLSLLFA